MICAKHLVYSFEIGILHEARERKSTGPDRIWDLFHALQSVYMRELKFGPQRPVYQKRSYLAIRVHARVEIVHSGAACIDVPTCNPCTCAS